MTSPRIFPCSSTIDFSFRIVPLSSPRTSTRLFQVSEDGESSTEIRTRRSSRGAREAGTGLKVPGNRMPQLRSDPPPRLPISGQVSPSSTPLGCALRPEDRKSTRLNSSHVSISYAVFCLKKKKKKKQSTHHQIDNHTPT